MFSDWSCVEEFLKMHVLLEGQAPQCSMGGGGVWNWKWGHIGFLNAL